MGAMRKLTLQFGMVNIPVAMNKATNDRKTIKLNELHAKCLQPAGKKSYCKSEGLDITSQDIIKGYEFTKGQYVPLPKAELDAIKIASSDAIIVQELVPRDQIGDPMLLTGDSYYLSPTDKHPQAYATMLTAMREENLVAIGRTCMYSREFQVAVVAGQHGFVMHMLRNQDEIRQEPQYALPTVDAGQLKLAKMIGKAQHSSDLHLLATDAYEAELKKVIDNKLAGTYTMPTPQAPVVQPTQTLEEQLRETLARITAKKDEAIAKIKTEEPKAAKSKKKARVA